MNWEKMLIFIQIAKNVLIDCLYVFVSMKVNMKTTKWPAFGKHIR